MRALFVGFSALVVVVALFPMPASAAPSGASASIDQCTNGPVGPPLSAQPCIGSNISAVSVAISGINSGASTSYKNWVNGNSNGSKSHWREGEFISYRTIINGLGAGPHTIVFTYDTVHSGGHAEDYIASYDATETTSSVPTSASGQIIHANNNSPCQDLVLAGQMPSSQCGSAYNASGVQTSPATPIATTATPAENFGSGPGGEQGCGGAGGSFSGTQQTGTLDLYGPTGSTIGPAIILTDNAPSGTGSCTTAVSLSFSVPAAMTASQAIVITWGGHIASRKDWGVGNSASSISGSPYHESLVSLDGASTGSQDRALATSAIFFTPTISTCIDGTNPCTTSINVGSPVFDTATLSGAATNAGGTVTYSFFTGNLLCSGTAATQVVTVNNAVVPNSATKTLTAGQYSYNATYSGDGTDIGPVTSLCEPLTVGKVPTATATAVFDAATNAAWSGTEKVGASAYDTATVSGQQDGIVPTGTVTYTFFANNTCSGTGTGAGTVTLTATAAVPNSNTEGPLAAGSYSFQATYSGDSNYSGSTGACEPFSVAKGTSSTSTAVFDAATNAAWSGTEATGASAYDTATVTTSNGFTATGTVTYTFFSNGICSGTGTGAGTVTLTASGSVPKSNTAGPLAAGSYSFRATYSGDGNYSGSTGACEPFNVAKGTSSTATVVFDAATNATWSGTETTGSSAYDTATVTPSNGFTATGTVTYTFFSNGICSGTGTGAGTVTLTVSGSVPKSNTEGPLANGNYSFQAVYSGDNNYAGSTGACEPFAVGPGTSTTATAVFDAATNAPWSGAETTGASAYDTATVAPSDGFVATGTVTYTFFTNGICSGTGVSAGTETLDASGKVPHSMAEGPLKAGSYSFQATYSGDANYAGSTGACEPFAVKPGSSQTATAVFDAATNAAWAGTETTGAAAYDTAAVTTSDGFVATGSVTYNFFSNSTCSGAGTLAGTVTLTATGAVPNSSTEGPLMAGSYSFLAVYSGDSNYGGSTGPCEPFAVKPGSSQTATIVFDAATNAAWSGTETTGASAYDTATVTPSDGFVASGTVTYTFYSNSTCSGTGTGAGVVTLNAIGAVPNSNTEGPLAAGAYSFQAVYSGDGNYAGSTGACEPFSVAKGTSSTATVVFDALTNAPWSGTETTGASAYDTATGVASSVAFTPTGTVTYTFFGNGTCSGTGTLAGGGALSITGAAPNSATEGPLAAGSYSFQATYSGDGNYAGSTGACEPFTVNIGSSSTKTVVFDATTNAPWAGSETTGASAYDTATVTTSDGFVATGTVTYTFFTNIGCTGSGTSAGTVTLTAAGAVPNSSTEGPLMAGSYSFQASYSGDSNYAGSTGACEPFTVNIGSSQTATTVFDAATNAPWSGTETTGASAYDTATVTTSDGFVAAGTVTYTFFTNIGCTGTGTSAGTVALTAGGAVPNSSTEGPLQAGSYSFQAVYSGDNNYAGSTGACEPFTVNIGSSQTATTVFDAATNAPWSGTETTGA
ncbi:MAG TPA: hypothetical protein VGX27_04085, partial [Candidatus Dormibacteraeota bacterium]|nr:hypothetical protein [Candidatus Dormibacteraeota bacterium]